MLIARFEPRTTIIATGVPSPYDEVAIFVLIALSFAPGLCGFPIRKATRFSKTFIATIIKHFPMRGLIAPRVLESDLIGGLLRMGFTVNVDLTIFICDPFIARLERRTTVVST